MEDYALWKIDYQKALATVENLDGLLNEREKYKEGKEYVKGISRSMVLARSSLATLKESVDHLENILYLSEMYPSESSIPIDERMEMKDLMQTLKTYYIALQTRVKDFTASLDYSSKSVAQPKFFYDVLSVDDTVGEKRSDGNMAGNDFMWHQEEKLDNLSGKVEAMKFLSQNIHGEVTLHTKILSDSIDGAVAAQRNLSHGRRLLEWAGRKDKFSWFLFALFLSLVVIFIFELFFL